MAPKIHLLVSARAVCGAALVIHQGDLLKGTTEILAPLNRTGPRHPNGIDRLAAEGPGIDYSCSKPSNGPELLHRLLVRRPKPAKDWVDAE